ncbi:glycoside hydrolase family 3 N-terminal domain-containing protein [Bartonella taylorii]|uniref:glycoside hydrolase family 3 N-terminal domain-containing protein n=1 Tax=Bartonella taylorii TaxID=33046 RepID=UPI001FEF099A|nr:glycoside hydrolase family 3 N-terminal domain-containing protein [Bartonella taylorii]
MIAHIVVYEAIDDTVSVTLSKGAIENIIRKKIGFNRLLTSDDVSMKVLRDYVFGKFLRFNT